MSIDTQADETTQIGDSSPAGIADFVRRSMETLAAKRSELEEATSAAEKVKSDGDERIHALTREVTEKHLEALDVEDAHREAYNQALAHILDQKVITADVLKNMGHQKVGARKGRKPSLKPAAD